MTRSFATALLLVVVLSGGPCSADILSDLLQLRSLSPAQLVNVFWERNPSCWVQKSNATLADVLKEAVERIITLTIDIPSATFGLNCFAALTPLEFRNYLNTQLPPGGVTPSSAAPAGPSRRKRALPTSVDWRTKGYVTPVKNQGQCGSCWAFAAAAALEGALFAKTGKLVSVSEQNLIDCTKTSGGGGCSGGWITDAYDYVKNNSGVASTPAYPYVAASGSCAYNAAGSAGTVSGFAYTKPNDEADLMNAVATRGPVAIVADATDMQHYEGGVLRCNPVKVFNHGLAVVGYGSGFLGMGKYWIVKNSWGAGWGENGYLRIAKDAPQYNCGITRAPSYPLP